METRKTAKTMVIKRESKDASDILRDEYPINCSLALVFLFSDMRMNPKIDAVIAIAVSAPVTTWTSIILFVTVSSLVANPNTIGMSAVTHHVDHMMSAGRIKVLNIILLCLRIFLRKEVVRK